MRWLLSTGFCLLLGCIPPVERRDAPESPVKACQEAFLCARECFDRTQEPWVKDNSCVAACARRFDVDSPCGGRPPAEFGADLAWGCEGAQFDSVWGDQYVPGLCEEDAIEVCGCPWDAYECTDLDCEEPGTDGTGDGTSTGSDDTGAETGADTGTGADTETGADAETGADSTGTGTGGTTGGN